MRIDVVNGGFDVITGSGNRFLARTIICASGSFNRPYIPYIPGSELFQGKTPILPRGALQYTEISDNHRYCFLEVLTGLLFRQYDYEEEAIIRDCESHKSYAA
ncbi:hypothetical protein EJP82_06455 [Paenibacillus anaericanus]|uniref:Uncharacterized protein n=1 Tax=Paenibacillus anaericanus TaxID=170367 RepID=A0A3S1KA05_9BACL|nr:hypothetical protein EJP82_06455 [Paenibacillus anaericanus]